MHFHISFNCVRDFVNGKMSSLSECLSTCRTLEWFHIRIGVISQMRCQAVGTRECFLALRAVKPVI